ncbi:MAG: 5-formyltetrahydrofolate cyclo-ligase [Burkholderiales bacterium]|nr:5-formyltetrahydrofolate cyclo-ligase [Nitrosomonas sp.]MCP5275360.1 5-formyltetrahydrofolate cyclo-ligase [Burkholderiales bacterium]
MENWQIWRKKKREQIITDRIAASDVLHQQWSQAISAYLQQGFPGLKKMKIGLYWPFRGEYDPRDAVRYFMESGAILALPEVVDKDKPLCFREWWPGAPMKTGAYNIPVPHGTPCIQPDALIIPMVGFDGQGYRLGYGSGYFDRTLATYVTSPRTIGVAFELQRLDNVHPQLHDIAMQYVVTEAGIFQTDRQVLIPVSTKQCAVDNAVF